MEREKKIKRAKEQKKRGETGEEDEGTPVKLILKSPCRPL